MASNPQSRSKTATNKKNSNYTSAPVPSKEAFTSSVKQEVDENANSSNSAGTQPTHSESQDDPATELHEQEVERHPSTTLTLPESIGDIFSAPPNTLLIHSCNCEGSWGAGIAAAFHSNYPSASKIYSSHCAKHGHSLSGKALLIPPSEGVNKSQHFVGCLFTSRSKGKKKDSPGKILAATGPAMKDLMRQVRDYEGVERVGEVRMCKINSGLFAVKWEKTKAVMEGIEVGEDDFDEVKVVSREA